MPLFYYEATEIISPAFGFRAQEDSYVPRDPRGSQDRDYHFKEDDKSQASDKVPRKL